MKCTIALLIAAAALLAGCDGSSDQPAADDRLPVAVSLPPAAWLVEQVGGERVSVLTILRPSDEPHTYQATDADIARVLRSRLYFASGVPFERGRWLQRIEQGGQLRMVDLRQNIQLRKMAGHLHDHAEGDAADDHAEGDDPHTWLSPAMLKVQARTVADALAQADPAHADVYRTNLSAVEAQLDQLDADLRATLAGSAGRPFLVFHPAWGYFADAYGLRQVAVEVEGKQPSDRELVELKQFAQRSGAKVLFVQPQTQSRSADAVARAIGGQVVRLDPLARDVPGNLRQAARAIAAGAGEAPR